MATRKDKGKAKNVDWRDLCENEEELKYILSLPEIEREKEYDERLQKLEKNKERAEQLNQKVQSTKLADKYKQRSNALEDMRKKRNNLKERSLAKDDSESEELGEIESSDSGRDNDDSKELSSSSDESYDKPNDEKISFSSSDLERIRISRENIEKWWEYSIFKDTVIGCYTKLNVSGKSNEDHYIIAKIKDIVDVPEKPYNFLGKKCTLHILAEVANNSQKFIFSVVSNQKFSEHEFISWKTRMEKAKLDLPRRDDIDKKSQEIENAKNFKLTTEEIKELATKKKLERIKNNDRRINITYELSMLEEEYNSAKFMYEENGEKFYKERMAKLEVNIAELRKMEEMREKEDSKNEKTDKVSIINKRNMQKQKELDSSNHEYFLQKKLEEQSDKGNPYRRRECRPANVVNRELQKLYGIEDKPQLHTTNNESKSLENEEHLNKAKEVSIKDQFRMKFEQQRKVVETMKQNSVKLSKVYVDMQERKDLKENLDAYGHIFSLDSKKVFDLMRNLTSVSDGAKIISLKDLENEK